MAPQELCLAQQRGDSQGSHRQGSSSLLTPIYTLGVCGLPAFLENCDSVHKWRNLPTNTVARLAASISTFYSIHITVNGRTTIQARYFGKYSGMFQWERASAAHSLGAMLVLMHRKQSSFREEFVSPSWGGPLKMPWGIPETNVVHWRCSETVLGG